MQRRSAQVAFREFASSAKLATALARDVADILRRAILARGGASIAVSGGSTPKLFLEQLSLETLDWDKVVVTLVDERFVPPPSERSNERLVREHLLQNEARLARFAGLWSDTATAEEAAAQADAGIALVAARLDVAILGMGTDGHTASFFADAAEFDEATDPRQPRRVLAINSQAAGEPRLTLTLPCLTGAGFLALHIEGAEKRRILESALAAGTDLPVVRALEAAGRPVDVYWAPAKDE